MTKSVEQQQTKIVKIIESMQDYWTIYGNKSSHVSSIDVFIDDALYIIGVSIDEKGFKFSNGYKRFINEVLIPHLKNSGQVEHKTNTTKIVEQIHNHWTDLDKAVIHSEECWRWHPGCAIELLYQTINKDYVMICAIHRYIKEFYPDNELLKMLKHDIEQVHPELKED